MNRFRWAAAIATQRLSLELARSGLLCALIGSADHKKLVAAAWQANHNAPPVLEGQTFQFVDSPNRYGLPAHFELHVWAWRDNPNGAFVDWNTRVTCERQ